MTCHSLALLPHCAVNSGERHFFPHVVRLAASLSPARAGGRWERRLAVGWASFARPGGKSNPKNQDNGSQVRTTSTVIVRGDVPRPTTLPRDHKPSEPLACARETSRNGRARVWHCRESGSRLQASAPVSPGQARKSLGWPAPPCQPHALRSLAFMPWQRSNIGSRVTREGHATVRLSLMCHPNTTSWSVICPGLTSTSSMCAPPTSTTVLP